MMGPRGGWGVSRNSWGSGPTLRVGCGHRASSLLRCNPCFGRSGWRWLWDIPLATTRRTHSTKFCRVFAFMIVLCFRGVFEGARRNGNIRLAQFNHFRGEKHNCLLPLPLSWCYAGCVCCASCVFRSGASESAYGSLPTRSTRSAGAKCFTPIIPHPIFFSHACTRVLCHTPALVPNGTETCVFQRQLPSAYAFALVLHCPRVLGVLCVVVFCF